MTHNTESILDEYGIELRVLFNSRYHVSSNGIIYSRRYRGNFKILKPQKTSDGYLKINLLINGTTRSFLIHRLVALLFINNPKNKREVNHINGNKSDNRVENLEWATRSENQIHAYRTGLDNKTGILNTSAKLTEQNIFDIRNSNEFGTTLSKIYNVSHSTIYSIRNRKSWKHL